MTGAEWHRLDQLFHAARALSGAERDAFVGAACADEPELRRRLERLLIADQRAGSFIATPIVAGRGVWPEAEEGRVGQRVGSYRVVREIARGGMGAVYLAERADGLYQQRVALKLIKRGMDTEQVLARFRAERQILASLDHPYIARLLDGGTTDDGLPYFAMEYVEGEPIDVYVGRRGASLDERLQLFLQVCAAVSYAHQHLVVHRDIKPLNILVTAEGVPKLLDFGIAKVLQADSEEETSTVTGMRLLTPEYASPEQVEGRHATTGSDVYSLGVVLYELLTGRSPYRLRSRSPLDLIEALRTTDPERPSLAATGHDGADTERLRRRLRGDLDTIVLTALRKEPDRRYQTVDQLADDLRRHLAGLPVLARPDTFRYRTGKFIRRNRIAVAVGALAVLALLGGTLATGWQAREARAAQARAERRFNDVRKLANAVLFDYHDAIRDLRGSTPVRERLVRDALGYLDGLAREEHKDVALQRELAGAYRRVGDVQGGDASSLGDTEGAIASYRKAMAILEDLLRADAADTRSRRDLARVATSLGSLVWESGDLQGGLALARRAQTLLAPLVAASPGATDLRLELSAAYDLLGRISIDAGDYAGSLRFHRADLEQLESAPAGERARPALRRAISVAYGHLADAQVELGDLSGAQESHRRSLALRSELAAEFPDNADYERLVGSARYYLGTVLGRMGRWNEALELFRVGIDADSGGFGPLRVGEALAALGRHGEALPYFRRALRAHTRELRADTTNLYKRLAIAEERTRLCVSLARLGRAESAGECAEVAEFMLGTPIEPANAFPRAHFGGLWSDLGVAYEALADRPGAAPAERQEYRALAREMYRRCLDIWTDLTVRGLVSPNDSTRLGAARTALRRVESGLHP